MRQQPCTLTAEKLLKGPWVRLDTGAALVKALEPGTVSSVVGDLTTTRLTWSEQIGWLAVCLEAGLGLAEESGSAFSNSVWTVLQTRVDGTSR